MPVHPILTTSTTAEWVSQFMSDAVKVAQPEASLEAGFKHLCEGVGAKYALLLVTQSLTHSIAVGLVLPTVTSLDPLIQDARKAAPDITEQDIVVPADGELSAFAGGKALILRSGADVIGLLMLPESHSLPAETIVPVSAVLVMGILRLNEASAHENTRAKLLGVLSGATHDIRNKVHLAMLETAAVNAQDTENGHTGQPVGSPIEGALQDIFEISENMITFSKIDTQRNGQFEVEAHDLELIVTTSVAKLKRWADKKRIQLTCETQATPVMMLNKTLIERIISNLVGNSIKYTRPKGQVEVKLTREDGDILLAVTDNGIGIEPEHQALVFDRFFQVREHSDGSGVGLHIVRQCAIQHGGDVTLVSDPGKGSTFTVRIPIKPVDD